MDRLKGGVAMMMWGPMTMSFAAIFPILVIAGLIASVWWLLTQRPPRSLWRSGKDRAVEILRERYARGDISPEEFEARRRDLSA